MVAGKVGRTGWTFPRRELRQRTESLAPQLLELEWDLH